VKGTTLPTVAKIKKCNQECKDLGRDLLVANTKGIITINPINSLEVTTCSGVKKVKERLFKRKEDPQIRTSDNNNK
tara:strand:- start:230 stop:457 length:228 start_codon:yes stop_codon:yes gene_type:complete